MLDMIPQEIRLLTDIQLLLPPGASNASIMWHLKLHHATLPVAQHPWKEHVPFRDAHFMGVTSSVAWWSL